MADHAEVIKTHAASAALWNFIQNVYPSRGYAFHTSWSNYSLYCTDEEQLLSDIFEALEAVEDAADQIIQRKGGLPSDGKEANGWAYDHFGYRSIAAVADITFALARRKRKADAEAKAQYAANPAFGSWG